MLEMVRDDPLLTPGKTILDVHRRSGLFTSYHYACYGRKLAYNVILNDNGVSYYQL